MCEGGCNRPAPIGFDGSARIATPFDVGTGRIVTSPLVSVTSNCWPSRRQVSQAALDALVGRPESLLEIRVACQDGRDRGEAATRIDRGDLDAAREAAGRRGTPLEHVRHEQPVALDAGPDSESDELSFLEEGAIGRRRRQEAEEPVFALRAGGCGQCIQHVLGRREIAEADRRRQEVQEQVPLARRVQHELLLPGHRAAAAIRDRAAGTAAAAGGNPCGQERYGRREQWLAIENRHLASVDEAGRWQLRRAGPRAVAAGDAACAADTRSRGSPSGSWLLPSGARSARAFACTRRQSAATIPPASRRTGRTRA